jgi:hypothetical protein
VVDRPTEVAEVVAALLRRDAGTVGITTALYGAGGFGKTTVAQMVYIDDRVKRRFKGRVYFVTIGREVRGSAAIAAKVNEVIKLVVGGCHFYRLGGRRPAPGRVSEHVLGRTPTHDAPIGPGRLSSEHS